MRGGDGYMPRNTLPAEGRSPRARGRLVDCHHNRARNRSIPACAGETPSRYRDRVAQQVDPRVRGGDTVTLGWLAESAGRSPRARGRPVLSARRSGFERSIPACAGETSNETVSDGVNQVDPRVRGGDEARRDEIQALLGRSPRARGRLYISSV